MRDLIRRILERPVAVTVAAVAVVVMGILSFLNIPLQLLPDGFEARHITVRANLHDSSAAEAERHVTIPLEEALATVAGIESVRSRSERDGVRVTVELKSDADPAGVERDVRDRIARVEPDLPDDVDRLRVRREGANDQPIMFFACTADMDRLELSDFVEDSLLPKIGSVDGVARTSAWGVLRRSVRIWLDPEEVARRQVDLRDLLTRLRADNLSADLGDVREGDRTAFVRASMDFGSLDEIRGFQVMEGLKLGDIARVEVVPGLDQGWSRYNGNAVLVGTIYKRAGANTVETCARIRKHFDEIVANNPDVPKLEMRPFFDQGEIIEKSLETLYRNALYGGILAVILLYVFFWRLRMTLLVAAAIPLSLTIAVTVLYLGADSLNIATMMGLTLAVGMLIDSAIVVVEAILRRREAGDSVRDAAAVGTGEVALAVLTATLTTIIVVLPSIFLGENEARLWLMSIGKPIAFALLASLGVALVLVPLGSIYLRRREEATASGGGTTLLNRARNAYARLLAGALRQRLVVVVLAVLVCASAAIPFGAIGRKGAMGRGGGPVRVFLRWPRHFKMADSNRTMKEYEEFVMALPEALGIRGVYARFDKYSGMVMVWKRDDSDTPQDEIRDALVKDWPQIPGVWHSLQTASMGGQTKVSLEGEDPALLERTMDLIEARLERLPSVAETQRERGSGLQELRVEVDPDAVGRGMVVPDRIRGILGWVVRGARLRDYRSKGRDLPLLIELDPDMAPEVRNLGELRIPTEQGPKPMSTLTRLEYKTTSNAIERRDGRRVTEMDVVGKQDDDKAFHGEVYGVLQKTKLPPGVRFSVGGSWQELQKSFSELGIAMMLSCVLVFLLTGVLFEALLLPLAVLVAIPPALIGGVWALYIAGKPLDELSFLGGILLIGVVVNNAIVLIDRVQQWKRDGLPLRSAIQAAGRDRLRPVVMTALTTIVGLLPMAIIKGQGNQIPYDTLATAIIGGLFVSTAMTLILVPVVYSLLFELGELVKRSLRRAVAAVVTR